MKGLNYHIESIALKRAIDEISAVFPNKVEADPIIDNKTTIGITNKNNNEKLYTISYGKSSWGDYNTYTLSSGDLNIEYSTIGSLIKELRSRVK